MLPGGSSLSPTECRKFSNFQTLHNGITLPALTTHLTACPEDPWVMSWWLFDVGGRDLHWLRSFGGGTFEPSDLDDCVNIDELLWLLLNAILA